MALSDLVSTHARIFEPHTQRIEVVAPPPARQDGIGGGRSGGWGGHPAMAMMAPTAIMMAPATW